jgi:gamma-butyrobetaine dioxygenase
MGFDSASRIVLEDGRLMLRAADGAFPIHPHWLRERCQGAALVDLHTQQRLYNPCRLDPDLAILCVTEQAPGAFRVAFSDGVTQDFAAAALLAELQDGRQDFLPTPVPWRADTPSPPSFDWAESGSDAWMLAALRRFLTDGYVILHGVPTDGGAVMDVARRFGHVRETNFGTMFDVKSLPDGNDLAYTALFLDPHTDNPYRSPVPGIQLLHCLVNETEGGLSTLADGLAVAEALRRADGAAYEALCTVPVRFRFIDAQDELVRSAPLIERDAYGRFAAINFSPRVAAAPLLPPAEMALFFAARRLLDTYLADPGFERRFKLMDGELMMFDNRRVLHGRTGYDPSTGNRHLQGCYIDLDAPRSHYRVLRRRAA